MPGRGQRGLSPIIKDQRKRPLCIRFIPNNFLDMEMRIIIIAGMQEIGTKKKRNPKAIPVSVRKLSSLELLQNNDRLVIEHNGQEYTLRITQNDKLILTK